MLYGKLYHLNGALHAVLYWVLWEVQRRFHVHRRICTGLGKCHIFLNERLGPRGLRCLWWVLKLAPYGHWDNCCLTLIYIFQLLVEINSFFFFFTLLILFLLWIGRSQQGCGFLFPMSLHFSEVRKGAFRSGSQMLFSMTALPNWISKVQGARVSNSTV